ncbi:MAG: type II secretion system protein [Moritella sp.]|uniref:PulJ/GspJ family protein n=1 Tax=Moritella sp. TaxID=78556 RepID=UPI001E029734|nr:type II secretion system protein [Moritella sp.]NQZ48986.1 type II secretion system protein [Moritella sp.]
MPGTIKHKQSGFTLVELVMVIILLGVIGTFSSRFISDNVILYQTSVNQNERLNDARFVLNRMSKELDSAIAFSVTIEPNITGQMCIQFVPFTAAGQYINNVAGQSPIELIMDPMTRSGSRAVTTFIGQRISVFTTNADDFYITTENASDSIATISTYIASGSQATLDLDEPLDRDSAVSRYFIAENKVQYCLRPSGDSMALSRSETFLTDSVYPLSVLMVDNLSTNSSMTLTTATQFSNAILELNFGFLLRDGSEIKFEHQVVMTNVP